MGRYHSYINSALKILQSYHGEIPFSIFIKQFFAKEKKYGSKDRKQITSLCFSWFRAGSILQKQLNEENLLRAFFIVTDETSLLLEALRPEWNRAAGTPAEEKIQFLGLPVTIAAIFPFGNELNEQTNTAQFYRSFLQQPYLFLRIRPGYKRTIIEKMQATDLDYLFFNDNNTVQVAPGSNIENIAKTDREVVVQDYNSQQVLHYLTENIVLPTGINAWDCCAASGGKSILLYDLLQGKVNLTVSDIRQSIMANLQQRFKNAGIKNYNHFIADISDPGSSIPAGKYDLIICDAPCTGSGTWSRTPEQLYYFNPASIDEFADRQIKIATNVVPYLKKDGLFFYITCSVFKKENEAVAEYIGQQRAMELIYMKNLPGYDRRADSMFVAVFKKVSH